MTSHAREHFVYWLFDDADRCLYVGMTRQPEARFRQHRATKPDMIAQVATKRMAGPFGIDAARQLEREQQDDLSPVYDGRLNRPPGYTVGLRADAARQLRGKLCAEYNVDLAAGLDIHPAQVSRALSGKQAPGTRFIAGVIDRCGLDFAFREVFEVVPDESA